MLNIIKIKYNCDHENGYWMDNDKGSGKYLMVFAHTESKYIIDGITTIAEPGSFILYDKRTPIHLGAVEGKDYISSWMTFDSDEIDSLVSDVYMNKVIYVGDGIDVPTYFRMISECYFRGKHNRALRPLIMAMLSEITEGNDLGILSRGSHYRQLVELRQRIFAEPQEDWSITRMAELLNVSRPHFQTLYRQAFGVTSMNDVFRSRIDRAKEHLIDPSISIKQISQRCGYKNAVHFSRQFKQITGMSPLQYRKKMLRN